VGNAKFTVANAVHSCDHYTQVVWRASTKIGCACVVRNNGGPIINCNYSPQGNFN
jgi:pathogenesis-related protein 1